MEPPSGTVTFLFTDIQGSTSLWQLFPSAMPQALARHHTLLRRAIEDQNGYVFQIVGDAFCAAFHTARDGLDASIASQRSLAAEPWGETGPLRVRMALHTGAAELRPGEKTSGEYVSGLTLSRAARLLSAGHGGQVLLSQTVHDLLAYELRAGEELLDLGEHRLKDLQRPEHIFQLHAPGLIRDFPPLKTLDYYPNNLPIQLTSFIGREKETAEIERLTAPARGGDNTPVARLITLTGPGGSGKTRLSLQVGSNILEAFPDGVWLVELAPLSDPGLLPQTLAAVIGVAEKPGQSLTQAIFDYLRPKSLLIILDNCEHLVQACARLAADLLQSCARVSILASSRESLNIPGEVSYPVPTLSLPGKQETELNLEALLGYESFRLFVERARAVQPRFQLDRQSAQAILKICLQLDGIPLAIEMAAARTRMLAPAQIAARLSDRFRLLTDGGRLAPARQQTLHALIDWSYDLLLEQEQALFRRLSIFAGSWTLEAAEEVCAGLGRASEASLVAEASRPFSQEIAPLEVFELLGQLVNKSMAVIDYDLSGENRYHFLETIRQYAWEKLVEAGEAEIYQERYARYFLDFATAAEPFLEGSGQTQWMDRLDKEIDNLRSALTWSCHPERFELGMRLAGALKIYWYTRGYFSEGREWLERLLAFAEEPNRIRANALDQAGFMARYQCDFDAAGSFIGESMGIWRSLGEGKGLADSLTNLGYVTLFKGDLQTAHDLYQESLQINRQLGNQQGIADALSHLGVIAFYQGELERADVFHHESLAIWRKLGDQIGVSHALNRLASVAFQSGRHEEARKLATESLRIARELKYSEGIAWTLEILAAYAAASSQPGRAIFLETVYTEYRQRTGMPASPAQRQLLDAWLRPAYLALAPEEIEQRQAEGRRTSIEQVVSQILST